MKTKQEMLEMISDCTYRAMLCSCEQKDDSVVQEFRILNEEFATILKEKFYVSNKDIEQAIRKGAEKFREYIESSL